MYGRSITRTEGAVQVPGTGRSEQPDDREVFIPFGAAGYETPAASSSSWPCVTGGQQAARPRADERPGRHGEPRRVVEAGLEVDGLCDRSEVSAPE
jgi:hypothetical protein